VQANLLTHAARVKPSAAHPTWFVTKIRAKGRGLKSTVTEVDPGGVFAKEVADVAGDRLAFSSQEAGVEEVEPIVYCIDSL
jgi:hypothetical protein